MSVSTSIRQASPAEMAAEIDRRGAVIEELEASLAAQRSRDGYPALAIDQLRNHQTQLDMDGVMVGVSRQAIDEVLTYFASPPRTEEGGSRDQGLEDAARRLEDACNRLAEKRSVATYLSMIDADNSADDLRELDAARAGVRAALKGRAK